MNPISRRLLLLALTLGTSSLAIACVEPTQPQPLPIPFDEEESEATGDSEIDPEPEPDPEENNDPGPDPEPDPEPEPNPDPQGPDELNGDFPFTLDCSNVVNNIATLTYEVSASATSYMVMPITSNGNWLWPLDITTPSGTIIDFDGANAFQRRGAQSIGVLNPTIIPAAPQFDFQLESGSHSYRLQTQDSEICYYIVESTSPNDTLDINIYPVGLDDMNITADNASTHPQLQAMLSATESNLGAAGLSFGRIRYVEFPEDSVDALRVMRDDEDLSDLLSHSQYPGFDEDSAMSLNIFIVERFAFSDGEGVLGVSMGAPGAAGLHGTGLSGVALTGEYIGRTFEGGLDGNDYTALIMAHELSHFIGLQHTSETSGNEFDPLQDTPECNDMDINAVWECPDWGNLMFPIAAPQNSNVTAAQTFVLGANPLTK